MPHTISIVVVDDHELLRGLLVEALEAAGDFKVVGQASDAETGIDLCEQLRPDVAILDSILPGQQGPDAVEPLLRASPGTRILMVSGAISPLALRRALAGGARGFVPKTASLTEMMAGVRAVYSGEIFCGSTVRQLVQRILEEVPKKGCDCPLSARERDVLAGIALGKSSKEVAGQLRLSVFTVENHRRRIMDRTGVRSIAGLTLMAVELGLIHVPHHAGPVRPGNSATPFDRGLLIAV